MPSVYRTTCEEYAHYSRQGCSANFAYTRAVVVMVNRASMDARTGWLYVSASSWQDPPTGPTFSSTSTKFHYV